MFNAIKKIFGSDVSDSLSKKTAKGSFWLLMLRIFDQGFGFIGTIVLARLLAPADFGLFGIALIALSFLDAFSQSGFQSALIHKKGDIRSYLDTGFVVQVARGFLIALILFLGAPYIALFFEAPTAEPILRVIGLVYLIQGLTNIATIYLQKELEFKKYFLYQISGTLAEFVVAVTLAIIFRNVWALVMGYLAAITTRCVISYVVYFYKPALRFDFAKAKELVGYGKWVFGSNIIGFFMAQIDSFFVTKIGGVASLGFYQIAYKVPSILNLEMLAGATFPAYSKIQDDAPRLKEAYLKITKIFSLILFPMTAGIFIIAPDFITLFLGEKWLPSLWPMRMLSLSALVWTIAVISDYLFMAIGKPNIHAKWALVRLVVLGTLLYPFIVAYGFTGASIAVLVGSSVAASGLVFEALRIIYCSPGRFIHAIIFPCVSALIMAVCVYALGNILGGSMVSFFTIIAAGILLYFLLMLVCDKFFNTQTIQLLKESMRLLG